MRDWAADEARRRAHRPIRAVGGGIRVATVKEPFGNLFGLIKSPHLSG
jgi:hypothetical protein